MNKSKKDAIVKRIAGRKLSDKGVVNRATNLFQYFGVEGVCQGYNKFCNEVAKTTGKSHTPVGVSTVKRYRSGIKDPSYQVPANFRNWIASV